MIITADTLRIAVEERFYAVNGHHQMTAEDDRYVSEWFTPLEEAAASAGYSPDETRRLMLANRLPLPSYIRSDGAQMVFRDIFGLLAEAGGPDALPAWFAGHFPEPTDAVDEWDAYLSGQYVCLRSVTPADIRRKGQLCQSIERLLAAPNPQSARWLAKLHEAVDALDAHEPPFAAYDRLRFGGPISRDTLIDDVRRRYPREN